VNAGAPEGLEVPSPHVTPVVLHKNEKDSSPFEKEIVLKRQPHRIDDSRMYAGVSSISERRSLV
jgi:hypothetical protein